MQDIRTTTFAGSPLDRSTPFTPISPEAEDLPPLPNFPSLYIILSPTLHVLTCPTKPPTILFSPQIANALSNSIGNTSPESKAGNSSPSANVPFLLGIHPDNHLYYVLPLSEPPPENTLQEIQLYNATFRHLRSFGASLPRPIAAIAAHARSLAEFHIRHKFCGLCGSATIPHRHGSRRRCIRNTTNAEPVDVTNDLDQSGLVISCKGVWFPRTDPVAIMLVVNPEGTHALLGRQTRFPQGWYSCLAGFMEHGEGVEDAVRREVLEEAGVAVSRVRFFASQPWPFPYSLMLGCVALAKHENIIVDQNELEDAKWFSREQVAEMVLAERMGKRDGTDSGVLAVPPANTAIAGQMCEAFAKYDPITVFEPSSSAML